MFFDEKGFGQRIKKLRVNKGLTQERMADELAITVSYLAKLEIGTRTPSIDSIIQLAAYFGVSLDYLVLGCNSKEISLEERALSLAEALEIFAAHKMNQYIWISYVMFTTEGIIMIMSDLFLTQERRMIFLSVY